MLRFHVCTMCRCIAIAIAIMFGGVRVTQTCTYVMSSPLELESKDNLMMHVLTLLHSNVMS